MPAVLPTVTMEEKPMPAPLADYLVMLSKMHKGGDPTPSTSFLFLFLSTLGTLRVVLWRDEAPHQCPLESVTSYTLPFYADVRNIDAQRWRHPGDQD